MNQEEGTLRRPHLSKEQRLPQSYKEVEKILNKVKRCESNVKTILFNSRLRGAVLHKVSGLTYNVLKQSLLLDSIIEKTELMEKEPYLRKEMTVILVHEMIFGKGLIGESKPVETIKKYQRQIEDAYKNLISDGNRSFNNLDLISIPKYVRVNTLMTTMGEVLEDLEYSGVKQVIYEANLSEKEFYSLVRNLEKNTFLLDYHFKDLIVFHARENLTSWSLYRRGHVFIQDKSSYIPAFVLAPTPGVNVIDACAAPGMKTLHLTALMENEGSLYAFERNENRFNVLNDMLKSGHSKICQTLCCDFNSVDPYDEKYSSVEYILLDPSCSGSGMVNRMDAITDTKESKSDSRLQKLAGFQIILLKHALLFPSVRRVVYSTCSITETENEYVVHEVLRQFNHKFKLSPVLPHWPIRGSDEYEFGSLCLRAFPEKCLTNGFFVAMFERIEDYSEQYDFEEKPPKREKKRSRSASKLSQNDENNYESSVNNIENNFNCDENNTNYYESNANYSENNANFVQDTMYNLDLSNASGEDLKTLLDNNNITEDVSRTINKKSKKLKKKKSEDSDLPYLSNPKDTLYNAQHLTDKRDHSPNQNSIQINSVEVGEHQKKKHKKKRHSEVSECFDQEETEKACEKKHKKKHSKKDSNDIEHFEWETAEAENRVDAIQKISLSHKKRKKKVIGNEYLNRNTEVSATEEQEFQNHNFDSNSDINIVTDLINPHRKKHKRKRDISECTDQNIFTQTEKEKMPQVKKHKKKHNINDSVGIELNGTKTEENQSADTQEGSLTDAAQEIKLSHKKRKKKVIENES